ncbi:hypothetical protein OAJ65_03070, partial [Flavobacteriales bacterium]|nr:hypothetical protein [Flavobacteriales bacterium]
MGKLETPLTWALVILVLGYFIAGNCCKVESNDQTNNGFSWSTTSDELILPVKTIGFGDSPVNVDSILEAVLQEVSDTIELENDV